MVADATPRSVLGCIQLLTVKPASDEKYSLKVWRSGRNMLQVRIYSDVPRKAAIIVYSEAGRPLVLHQKQLNAGINTYSIYVGNSYEENNPIKFNFFYIPAGEVLDTEKKSMKSDQSVYYTKKPLAFI